MWILPRFGRHGVSICAKPVNERLAVTGGVAAGLSGEEVFADAHQPRCGSQHGFGFLIHAPVNPGDLIVLAVHVVVSALTTTELVPGGDHRNTLSQQHGGHEVPCRTGALGHGMRVVGDALNAVVPATVIVRTVAVVFPVVKIVLVVVGGQISHREAVVCRD